MTDRQRSFNYPNKNHDLKVFTILVIDSFYSCYIQEVSKWCDAHAMTSRRDITWRHVTSWRHSVTSHDILCHDRESTWAVPSQVSKIHVFQHGDLDLWPWPSNSSEILSRYICPPNFGSVLQTVRPWERWQTHTQTHRRDRFHTLDRLRGRESAQNGQFEPRECSARTIPESCHIQFEMLIYSKNIIFEPTCAYARWALRYRFLSVCHFTKIQTRPKVTRPKVTRPKFKLDQKPLDLNSDRMRIWI